MERDLIHELRAWREKPLRTPLILRGARQVGKSWLIDHFGQEFEAYVKINFEKEQRVHHIFKSDLNIDTILEKLSLYAQQKIVPGKTLLFFDEIQVCERAITALRYFKEECPALHIIAAGSLLDFTIEKLGIPVGRVEFLYLYPLSLGEYLLAIGKKAIREALLQGKEIPSFTHDELLDDVKNYMWLGGMPEVITAWLETKDPQRCQEIQNRLIQAYKQDFERYAKERQIPLVEKTFEKLPQQCGKKFMGKHVDREARSAPCEITPV